MRRHLARVSPIRGFLALPTWMGPVGLTDVCSKSTFPGRGSPLPKSSRRSKASLMTRALSTASFTLKLI